ncbi:pisatin demethylase [Podospora didyma]|uniref:Pisatin demethylase n=1 Tax=Podospora didyma TaxID=330526 RepID=A0AAE0K0E9_9PEZI|nr:pisatin demethylase [Podospora didyma]
MPNIYHVTATQVNSFASANPRLLIATGIAVSLITWLVVSNIRQWLRLRHFPGPPIAGFSKWWLLRHELGGNMISDLADVTNKYGSFVRIAPNLVITDDPKFWKQHVLNVRTTYQRSNWYYGMRFDPKRDNILSTRDDALHNQLRSKMAAGYSGREVENLQPKLDQVVLAFMKLLENKYIAANKPFDLATKAQYFTMDAISQIAYGQPFGFLTKDADVYEYIHTLHTNIASVIWGSVYPWIIDVAGSPIFRGLVPSAKDVVGFGKIMGIVKETAAERFGPNKKVQKDMLGSFIAHGLNQTEAESEIILQILAGSDTTATAIRSTMLYAITNPRVVSSIRAELDAAGILTPTDTASDEQIISDAASRALPYMQAVIKEGLRIHPPIAPLMSKVVPPGGDNWNGVHFPAGTEVGYSGFSMMRRRDVFGEDADEFRPERWLDSEPEKIKEMEGTTDLIFGHGRWQCLGRSIAFIELNKVFVELFRRFEFTLVDPSHPWKSDNMGIFRQSDLWIRGYKRS